MPDDDHLYPEFGERRQELVFIGIELDRSRLVAALDHCLLTQAEAALGQMAWVAWPDPFPAWELAVFDDL